jgi:hypothetical protein
MTDVDSATGSSSVRSLIVSDPQPAEAIQIGIEITLPVITLPASGSLAEEMMLNAD